MPALDPVPTALVPVDSAAADAIGAPNYDEFQSDREVWELLQSRPRSVLRVTMPHCDVASPDAMRAEKGPDALAHAVASMRSLLSDAMTRTAHDIVWVYEITGAAPSSLRQIGLGGMGRTTDIRTAANPGGTIIRNEGVRESKVLGRAELTRVTNADMGMVNLAVDDADGVILAALNEWAATHPVSFETLDESGNLHRVWLVEAPKDVQRMCALMAREPRAYVADGNHRSAAAAMLGYRHFLTVMFPAATMTIAPYNRLVDTGGLAGAALRDRLQQAFIVEPAPQRPFQPETTHDIGLFDGSDWYRLRPRTGTFDPSDAAQDIDADIVQRHFLDGVLGIADARDERITYVGANREAAWLQAEVDAGRHHIAITLPPVTMRQFVDVCLQDKLMPPKSTWFVPKVRTGLVIGIHGEPSQGS